MECFQAFFAVGTCETISQLFHNGQQFECCSLNHRDRFLKDAVWNVSDWRILAYVLLLGLLLVQLTLAVFCLLGVFLALVHQKQTQGGKVVLEFDFVGVKHA